MKRKSAELKRLAREALIGNWGISIGANVLMSLITVAVTMPFYFMAIFNPNEASAIIYFIAVFIIGVISMVLQCGILQMHFAFARGQKGDLGMLFREFTRHPDRYILSYLLLMVIEMVCALPGAVCLVVGIVQEQDLAVWIGMVLLIAGVAAEVVVALRYSVVFMLLVSYPKMRVMESFRESARLMQGNKGRFFYINLSFIGWFLLGILSCYVGLLWVAPYMSQTSVRFYQDITGELDAAEREKAYAEEKTYAEEKGYAGEIEENSTEG